MYGWIIICGKASNKILDRALGQPFKKLSFQDYTFCYNPMHKFEHDKLFYEDSDKIVLLDGVVLNIDELKKAEGKNSWRDTFESLLEKSPDGFMDALRGGFCGAVLYKGRGKMVAFTNHSGERTV